MRTERFIAGAIAIAVFALVLRVPAEACPVCYGAADSQATQGVTAAVLSLLGVTGGVLAAFASMFLRMRRRSRGIAEAEYSAVVNSKHFR